MLRHVIGYIERHRMFEGVRRVGVAVSGGADSMCLLDVLLELAPQYGLELEVLHLDHQLRGEESRADAAFVRKVCAELGLRCHIETAAVAEVPDNLEQAARRARRAFFGRLIAEGLVDCVATGHTRNDQAETVLFRFLRGAGTAGLAGIRPVTGDGIVRPLLDVTREQVLDRLRSRGIAWREDSTNAARQFARNRIRHDLLPQLEHEWNPAIIESLAQLADWARAEEEFWGDEADRLGALQIRPCRGGVMLSAGALAELLEAMARRMIRRAIQCVKGDLRGVDFGHVAAILQLANSTEGCGRFRFKDLEACRSFEWLRLGRSISPIALAAPLPVPGRVALTASGPGVSTELIEISTPKANTGRVYNDGVGCIDWERVPGPLQLRTWRPGDQYQPVGCSSARKLKELFQQARIPLWDRGTWPVITSGESIIWAGRFGPGAAVAAGPGVSIVLRIQEEGIGTGLGGV